MSRIGAKKTSSVNRKTWTRKIEEVAEAQYYSASAHAPALHLPPWPNLPSEFSGRPPKKIIEG